MSMLSAGNQFRAALSKQTSLRVTGAITACVGPTAQRKGYKALYRLGGGVAANSRAMREVGVRTMQDVLTHAHHTSGQTLRANTLARH